MDLLLTHQGIGTCCKRIFCHKTGCQPSLIHSYPHLVPLSAISKDIRSSHIYKPHAHCLLQGIGTRGKRIFCNWTGCHTSTTKRRRDQPRAVAPELSWRSLFSAYDKRGGADDDSDVSVSPRSGKDATSLLLSAHPERLRETLRGELFGTEGERRG